LPTKKTKKYQLSTSFNSFDLLNKANIDEDNALLAETIVLALNIGNNWKLKDIEFSDSTLSKKLKEKCKECLDKDKQDTKSEKEGDDKDKKEKKDKEENCNITIKDFDKNGKTNIHDLFLIANAILGGDQNTGYDNYAIANLICTINKSFC
jgi:hypothetical protein